MKAALATNPPRMGVPNAIAPGPEPRQAMARRVEREIDSNRAASRAAQSPSGAERTQMAASTYLAQFRQSLARIQDVRAAIDQAKQATAEGVRMTTESSREVTRAIIQIMSVFPGHPVGQFVDKYA